MRPSRLPGLAHALAAVALVCATARCTGGIVVDEAATALPDGAVPASPAGDGAAVGEASDGAPAGDGAADTFAPCPPGFTGATPPVSVAGARIRPLRLTSPDGLDVPYGFRDTLRGFDCQLSRGADGTNRCAPFARVDDISLRYTDPGCTTQGLMTPGSVPAFFMPGSVTAGGPCGNDHPIYALGGELFASYVKSGGACEARALPGAARFFAIAATLGPADLVAFPTTKRETLTPTLDAVFHVGDDGAKIFRAEVYDRVHDEPVRADSASGRFVGAAPAAPRRATPPPPDASSAPDGAAALYCASRPDFFPVYPSVCVTPGDAGTVFFEGSLYARAPGSMTTEYTCVLDGGSHVTSAVLDGAIPGFRLDAPRSICELEAASFVDHGGTRLTVRAPVAGGAPLLGTSGPVALSIFKDGLRGEECAPRLAADGQLRCMPLFVKPLAFLDASCTMPVGHHNGGVAKYIGSADINDPAGCTQKIWSLALPGDAGSKVLPAGTSLYELNHASGCTCEKVSLIGTTTYFDLGPEILPSAFAPVTLTMK